MSESTYPLTESKASWNNFYKHFQSSKPGKIGTSNHSTLSPDTAAVVCETWEPSSLLFETGGDFAVELFKECSFIEGDLTKLKTLLMKLEVYCLPKIIENFIHFTRSITTETFPISNTYMNLPVSSKFTVVGPPSNITNKHFVENNKSKSAFTTITPSKTQCEPIDEKRDKIEVNIVKELPRELSPVKETGNLSQISGENISVLDKTSSRTGEENDSKLDKTRSQTAKEDVSKLDNTNRRTSGRKVKVSAKLLDSGNIDWIRKTVRAEGGVGFPSIGKQVSLLKDKGISDSLNEPAANISNVISNENGESTLNTKIFLPCNKSPLNQSSDQNKDENYSNNNLSCDICDKQFSHKSTLNSHMKQHLGSLPLTDENKMDKDMKTPKIKHEKTFFCDEENCKKSFWSETSLNSHKRIHDESLRLTCPVCEKVFHNAQHLEIHRTVHTGERPHVCDICGKGFRLIHGMLAHKRIHNPDQQMECEICHKRFSDKRNFQTHLMDHQGIRPFQCSICSKGFLREQNLKTHMKTHTREDCYKCEECGHLFVSRQGLQTHSSIHTGAKPFVCQTCNKGFRIKKGLIEHMRMHDVELQFKCELCPRTFVEKRSLEYHMSVHKGEKNHKCDVCGDRFINKNALKIHNRRHTGEKPYNCKFCPKAFSQQGTLIAHERSHKGEKPYICNFCGDGFYTRSHMTIHKRKHTNERPYPCDQCTYAGTTRAMLKVHLQTHQTSKPYKCTFCPSAFKVLRQLESHLRRHSRIEEAENVGGIKEEGVNLSQLEVVEEKTIIFEDDQVFKGEILFQCDICEATFPSMDEYGQHMVATHEMDASESLRATQEVVNQEIVLAQDSGDHMETHDIVIVSTTPDGNIILGPKPEEMEMPQEVAYDIVLI